MASESCCQFCLALACIREAKCIAFFASRIRRVLDNISEFKNNNNEKF